MVLFYTQRAKFGPKRGICFGGWYRIKSRIGGWKPRQCLYICLYIFEQTKMCRVAAFLTWTLIRWPRRQLQVHRGRILSRWRLFYNERHCCITYYWGVSGGGMTNFERVWHPYVYIYSLYFFSFIFFCLDLRNVCD